jgi:hypothetical protein
LISGTCACGKVQYEVSGELSDFCNCHCSICRKIRGSAFASWGGIRCEEFTYVSGKDSLNTYAFYKDSDSISCSNCNSTLLVDYKPDADMLYIALGAVDRQIESHQYVNSKASWFHISDELL